MTMKHEIKPFNPDKIYEMVLSVHFSIKAQSAEEAQEKLNAILAEMDADHWQLHRICEAGN
jgi:phage gp29-like protein